MRTTRIGWIGVAAIGLLVAAPAAFGQATEDEPGTDNMELIGQHHAGDGLEISYTDIELEQEPERPYAYLARVLGPTKGMDIVSIFGAYSEKPCGEESALFISPRMCIRPSLAWASATFMISGVMPATLMSICSDVMPFSRLESSIRTSRSSSSRQQTPRQNCCVSR